MIKAYEMKITICLRVTKHVASMGHAKTVITKCYFGLLPGACLCMRQKHIIYRPVGTIKLYKNHSEDAYTPKQNFELVLQHLI